jgi:PAS domain S-box-containing protein
MELLDITTKPYDYLGVVFTRIRDGRILHANKTYADIHGYQLEEIIGQSTLNLKVWAFNEQRTAVINELVKNGYFKNIQITAQRKNGEHKDCLVAGELIEMDGEKYSLGLILDILP